MTGIQFIYLLLPLFLSSLSVCLAGEQEGWGPGQTVLIDWCYILLFKINITL